MVRCAENGNFVDVAYADALVGFIVDPTLEPASDRYKTAVWFLLDSEHAFFVICVRAGSDAEKLRPHLRKQIL